MKAETDVVILIRRKLFACLYEFFKHHCLVCLGHFVVPKRYLKFCFIVNLSFFFKLCERIAFFSYKLISTVTVRRRARRKTFCQPICHVHFQKKKKGRKNKYVIHRLSSVRIEKNCALGLDIVPRPAASGRTQDLGHSFPLNGPPSR